MGEFEWQTVDRLLTPEEQARVRRLSSHIEVTPSRAVVTYKRLILFEWVEGMGL